MPESEPPTTSLTRAVKNIVAELGPSLVTIIYSEAAKSWTPSFKAAFQKSTAQAVLHRGEFMETFDDKADLLKHARTNLKKLPN